MNQILGLLDKMKDMDVVKFFSRFFTQETLSPWMRRIQEATGGGSYADTAKSLLLTAAVLALAAFVIDQAFYMTHPEQIALTRRRWAAFEDGIGSLGGNAKALVSRVRVLLAKNNRGGRH